MKPRSKRNRKRPRSDVNGLKDDPVYETLVRPIELDGKQISATTKWLRVIKPYPYTYSTFAKARWEGRTVLDVYATEFGSYPKSYYETAISQGRILVSDKKVPLSYIVKGGDVLSHTVHRHEPGVAVQSEVEPHVTIVDETSELLIVEKPGTMPVHPCGGYNMQSLVNILEKYYKTNAKESTNNVNKLYTIHRLDRLTSGLVILGKTSAVAQSYSRCIMDRSCQKIYLARVAGKFPLKYQTLKTLSCDQFSKSGVPLNGEWTECSSTEEKQTSDPVARSRKLNALSCWIEDGKGNPIFESEGQSDTSVLEKVFRCRHSVDEWLKSIDPDCVGKDQKDEKVWFHLACPTRIAKHKDGVCEASSFETLEDDLYKKTVKPAHSSFGVVSYDEATDSTLLICRPYTGRTHQLRLHLQHLQHPIANDPNYGGDIWYGNPSGKEICSIAQDRLNIINTEGDLPLNEENVCQPVKRMKDVTAESESFVTTTRTSAIDVPATESEVQDGIVTAVRQDEESIHDFIKRTCVWCARSRSVPSEDRAVLEFVIRSPGIWLHALQYSFPTSTQSNDEDQDTKTRTLKTFRANLPDWHDTARI